MEYVAQTYLMSKTRRTHMLSKRFLSDKEAFLSIRDTNSVVLNMNLRLIIPSKTRFKKVQ